MRITFSSSTCLALCAHLLLSACGTSALRPVAVESEPAAAKPAAKKAAVKPNYALKKGGGFYLDDGPGDNPPEDMEAIPDAVPRVEPLHKFANNPYSVLGKDYVPLRSLGGYKAQGIASWYGKKFHGQKTSSGEPYDMYGMTAAHPILPIPSYVRVTNPANGKAVVLRVNDRGPFHADRIIDLSYTASWKLGLVGNGSGQVIVESVMPGDELPVYAAAKPEAKADAIEQMARREDTPIAKAASSAPVASVAGESKGTFIQLGAFGNPENAESFRAHMARELDSMADLLRTEVAGKLHRVQLGPFANRSEAESAVARIMSSLGVKATIVVR